MAPNQYASSAPARRPPSSNNYTVIYRPSPFYVVKRALHNNLIVRKEVFANLRQIKIGENFILEDDDIQKLEERKEAVLILSAELDELISNRTSLIQFPLITEIRVNGISIPASYTRGVKGKPGTARPPDITQYVASGGGGGARGKRHMLELTIMKPKNEEELKKNPLRDFIMNTYLVEVISMAQIIETLKSRPIFTKESVVERIIGHNKDEEVVATTTFHRLKDPITFIRIKIPIRSSLCDHIDCFDAQSYLMLQMQAPTWLCPICNKVMTFETLAIDGYISDILENTAPDVDEVEVHPDATWSAPMRIKGENKDDDDSDSDEELYKRAQRNAVQNNGHENINDNRPIYVSIDSSDDEDEAPTSNHRAHRQSAPLNRLFATPEQEPVQSNTFSSSYFNSNGFAELFNDPNRSLLFNDAQPSPPVDSTRETLYASLRSIMGPISDIAWDDNLLSSFSANNSSNNNGNGRQNLLTEYASSVYNNNSLPTPTPSSTTSNFPISNSDSNSSSPMPQRYPISQFPPPPSNSLFTNHSRTQPEDSEVVDLTLSDDE